MKSQRMLKFFVLYVILLCMILSLSILLLYRTAKQNHIADHEGQTDWIYVYESKELPTLNEEESTTKQQGWILRTYEGRIGIFTEDGTLVDMLDTYVKTLPKADRQLLEEGIYAENEEKLHAWIEDYSE